MSVRYDRMSYNKRERVKVRGKQLRFMRTVLGSPELGNCVRELNRMVGLQGENKMNEFIPGVTGVGRREGGRRWEGRELWRVFGMMGRVVRVRIVGCEERKRESGKWRGYEMGSEEETEILFGCAEHVELVSGLFVFVLFLLSTQHF